MGGTTKTSVRIGSVNFLATIAAHIPCCGSQLFLGIFGLQTVGALSSTFFYKFQFLIPLAVTALMALGLVIFSKLKKKDLFCALCHGSTQPGNLTEFFVVNLIIGYTIVSILYLFIPPHDHHMIDTRLQGHLSRDGVTISATHIDDERFWPWSHRHFVSETPVPGEKVSLARELYWYQILMSSKPPVEKTVSVHLYTRPSNLWMSVPSASVSASKNPMDFYITLNDAYKPLSAVTLIDRLDNKPALVLFYSQNCAPCKLEMKLLPSIKAVAPGLHIAVVTLTKPDPALDKSLKDLSIQRIDASGIDGLAVLRSFNNKQVALPFSLAIDSDNKVCTRRAGILGLEIVKEWRQACLP
jgi:thiol-disulfide isomerase/thioredoxin